MKALSIRQPWAELILCGLKKVENRKWRTNFRGQLLIHASMTHDFDCGQWLLENRIQIVGDCPHGVIVGTVEVLGCQRIEDLAYPDKFAFGPWCWILAKPRRLPKPIPYMGKLGLFDITEPYVLEQLPQ